MDLLANLPPGTDDNSVLEVMALSACADGVSREELDALAAMARELPTMRSLDATEVKAKVEAAFTRIDDAGLEPSLAAIAARAHDTDTRRRIFYAAVLVQHADGRVSAQENEFLLDLADALGLDDATSAAIVEEIETALNQEDVKV